MEKQRRPVDLPLLKIRLPIGGIVSIVHRITGVLLMLALPFATYWWDQSLRSEAGYHQAGSIFGGTVTRLAWLLLAAIFIQHLVSGIRHLLLDLHIGIDKSSSRKTAWTVPFVSLLLIAVSAWVIFR